MMKKKQPKRLNYARRVAIAQMAVDKFKDKEFNFAENRDYGMMALFVALKFGVQPHSRAAFGNYTTALGAKKAITKLGYANLTDLMVKTSDRIAPRSEERSVGKECVSTCRSRWSPYT